MDPLGSEHHRRIGSLRRVSSDNCPNTRPGIRSRPLFFWRASCSKADLVRLVPPPLSDGGRYARRMKNRTKELVTDRTGELIATFGEARLIQAEGEVCLRGGSMADRMEALEWLSMMMPEAVVCIEG